MISARRLVIPLVLVIVVMVVIVGAIYLALQPPAEVNEVTEPKTTIDRIRSFEDPVLNSYGWVDQKNGIARIPVSRAIDIVAAKGLPARSVAAGAPADQGQAIPSYSSSGTMPETPLR